MIVAFAKTLSLSGGLLLAEGCWQKAPRGSQHRKVVLAPRLNGPAVIEVLGRRLVAIFYHGSSIIEEL